MANLKFKDETGKWIGIPSIKGEPGEPGKNGERGEPGVGVIPGGLAGQYLRKKTDADYETEWADVESGGSEIDESVLLHYKGHVATIDDLPSTGQASGSLTSAYMGIDSTILGTNLSAIEFIKSLVGNQYYIGVYNSPTDYLIVSSADVDAFKDISFIKRGNGNSDSTTEAYAFVIVDESKEHNIQVCCNAGRSVAYLKTPTGSGTLQPSVDYKSTILKLKSIQLYTGANACLYGNVPNVLTYVENPANSIFGVNSIGNFWSEQVTAMTCLRLNFENNYVYTEGMQCLKSNGDGTLAWVLTESVAEVNDVYTVGENNDIYRCNNVPSWEHWSKSEKTTGNLVNYVSEYSSSKPFVFEGKQPGLYMFTGNSTVYLKGSSSDKSQISKTLGDNTLHIFKEYSEATAGETFAAYSGSDGRYTTISKVTSNNYGISDVSVVGNGFNYIKKPETLYESSGTTGNVTLSRNVSNYSYIDIIHSAGSSRHYTNTANSIVGIYQVGYDGDTVIIQTKNLKIDGTSITIEGNGRVYHYNGTVAQDKEDYISIYKVVGYK